MSELTELQKTTRQMAIDAGCDPDILDAGGHELPCRCHKCLKYWTTTMPEPPVKGNVEWERFYSEEMAEWNALCPFSQEEIGEAMQSWTE